MEKLSQAQWTLYASSGDYALRLSKVVHAYKRIGESDQGFSFFSGMDTIDASSTTTFFKTLGHSYVTGSPVVRSRYRRLGVTRFAAFFSRAGKRKPIHECLLAVPLRGSIRRNPSPYPTCEHHEKFLDVKVPNRSPHGWRCLLLRGCSLRDAVLTLEIFNG